MMFSYILQTQIYHLEVLAIPEWVSIMASTALKPFRTKRAIIVFTLFCSHTKCLQLFLGHIVFMLSQQYVISVGISHFLSIKLMHFSSISF